MHGLYHKSLVACDTTDGSYQGVFHINPMPKIHQGFQNYLPSASEALKSAMPWHFLTT